MMSLPHLTYDEYKTLGGTLEEEDFKTSYLTARSWVNYYCGANEAETQDQSDAVKRALASAVEVDSVYGASGGIGEGVGSMTIGSFSVSGNTSAEIGATNYQMDMKQVIYMHLSGTGLLFGGIDG